MPCDTCGHTMQATGCKVTDRPFFWCPRCGTFKSCNGDVAAPALVERCRSFAETFPPGNPPSVSYSAEWKRLGIAESINPPT